MAAASSSSASFFGIGEEQEQESNLIQLQMPSMKPTSSSAGSQQPASSTATPKKRRNQPGNPNPDAEVIALSPRTLLATNRFVCEVCNKGFQREQNLQLHRRGHNLPWRLRPKSAKEVRRKVYLCPEVTCVHHHPSRALGDLTGIKKHYSRKHGEKKWKCDKCSKCYAVQSDWKAHSKTCGTREYRCDCGNVFSRRDSFITHRAFCEALTQETERLPPALNNIGLLANSNIGAGPSEVNHHHHQASSLMDQGPSSADLLSLGSSQFEYLINQSNPNSSFARSPTSAFYLTGGSSSSAQDFHAEDPKPFHGMIQLPNTSSAAAASLFSLGFFSNGGGSSSGDNGDGGQAADSSFLMADQFSNVAAANAAQQMTLFPGKHLVGSGEHGGLYSTSVQTEPMLPQLSATALLQKAALMGATTSNGGRGFAGITKMAGENLRAHMESEASIQDLMNSLANGNAGIFGGSAGGGGGGGLEGFNLGLAEMNESKLHQNLTMGAGSDGLTRDFLGVGSVFRGLGGGLSQREQRGMESSMDPELQSGSSGGGRPPLFGGAGGLQ